MTGDAWEQWRQRKWVPREDESPLRPAQLRRLAEPTQKLSHALASFCEDQIAMDWQSRQRVLLELDTAFGVAGTGLSEPSALPPASTTNKATIQEASVYAELPTDIMEEIEVSEELNNIPHSPPLSCALPNPTLHRPPGPASLGSARRHSRLTFPTQRWMSSSLVGP